MTEATLRKQRAPAEAQSPLSPIERFSLLRNGQAELETQACAILDVSETGPGESVVDALAAEFGVELNAAEMLLAVHVCDGQHNGRLVWTRRYALAPEEVVQRRPPRRQTQLAHPAAQRRGAGVGGGV